jgi:hypothetical protein
MNRSLALGITLALSAAADAAEPVAPAPTNSPAAVSAPAATPPRSAKALDLRIRDVRFYMLPHEYRAALSAPDADKNTVVVEASRELLPTKYEEPVPGGIIAPIWALMNPSQGWRIFAPDLKRPPPGPPDLVPPPIFRRGP